MLEFIKIHYFLIGYGITLVMALIHYRKYFDTVLKYFPIIITYTLCNEFLGYQIKTNPEFTFFKEINYSSINEIIYNIYAFVFFSYFYFIFWKLNTNPKYKKIISISATLVIISYFISCFFQNPIKTNLYYSTAIGSWILVLCVVLYFSNKKMNKEKLIQPNNLMFWISISLLIFYSIFPFLYLIGYLNFPIWKEYNLLFYLRMLIVIMYSILNIGFFKASIRSFG